MSADPLNLLNGVSTSLRARVSRAFLVCDPSRLKETDTLLRQAVRRPPDTMLEDGQLAYARDVDVTAEVVCRLNTYDAVPTDAKVGDDGDFRSLIFQGKSSNADHGVHCANKYLATAWRWSITRSIRAPKGRALQPRHRTHRPFTISLTFCPDVAARMRD